MKKRNIRGTLAGVAFLGMLFVATNSTSEAASANLSDINGHWGKDQVEFAIQQGFVDGYPDGTFKPDQNVSRVEFMKLVVDALKFKKNPQTNEWYQPYLDAGIANGLHVAEEFPSDKLNDPISREEMARIAVRATGQSNYDAKKWMYLATSKGIINGMDDAGTLGPDQPTTRAQAVTVIRRIMKIREGASLPTDKYAISSAEIYWHKTNVLSMLPRYFSKIKQNWSFRDDLLTSSAWDGNVACSIDQYVVVDMDDPNDPNRSLVPDDLQVFDPDGFIKEITGSNYILVSQQTTHIKSFPKNTLYISGCYTGIMDRLFDDTGNLKAAGSVYQTAPLGAYIIDQNGRKQFRDPNDFKVSEGDQINKTTYTYQILPKGKLISTNVFPDVFRIGFYGIDANSPVTVYEGFINKEYSE
ncbi:S-layer homology domain-containing protein [Paenibacillus sp. NPDC056579]|uniref:S-layer homology domain-containing protein n=1 Tax=Paenibacillus sp. NPDC056579 TaxID=3345871 RepID=UPI0036AF9314